MNLPSRTHDALLAVHSIDEFVYSVPDLDEARRFYTAFGLDVRDEGEALALHTHGHPHRWARVLPGPAKRLLWLSLGIHAGDRQRFERHLAQRGVEPVAAPRGADAGGLWIEGPDGLPVQLRVASKSSPSQPAPREFPPESCRRGRSPSRSRAGQVRPLYLSHILLFSADVEAATRFYEDGWACGCPTSRVR